MSADIEKELGALLAQANSAPFLFIGSGFSRRYIDLPDWIGLLSKFSNNYPFERYLGEAGGDIPEASLKLAEDFSKTWWENHKEDEEIYKSSEWKHSNETPLKYEIAKFLKNYQINIDALRNHPELKYLCSSEVVIDGIITTNWDLLLERLFPNLTVYIGQSEILFKEQVSVGEILKIHGCCSKYNSLILTSNDYEDFNSKNPYLAAKLLSIFLEKPVIFIGYSLSDENISEILEKIEVVIDTPDKIEKLSKNLIFVSRANGGSDEISKVIKNINNKKLEITNIITDDYSLIYKALQSTERKIPVEFLRIFKDQIYKIISSKDEADLKLKAVNFESIVNSEEIEFVAGVGVIKAGEFGRVGIKGLNVEHLLKDIIFNDLYFEDQEVIESLVFLSKTNPTYLPVRKYTRADPAFTSPLSSELYQKYHNINKEWYRKKINPTRATLNLAKTGYPDIIKNKSVRPISRLDALGVWLIDNPSVDNCNKVREYIKKNHSKLTSQISKDIWKQTAFKRLVCILDEIENHDLV